MIPTKQREIETLQEHPQCTKQFRFVHNIILIDAYYTMAYKLTVELIHAHMYAADDDTIGKVYDKLLYLSSLGCIKPPYF